MPCPHGRLIRAVLGHGPGVRLVAAVCEDWTSATFTGMRHRLHLALPTAAAPRFIDTLDADAISIPGQLIVDLAATREQPAGGEVLVRIEAITVEAR